MKKVADGFTLVELLIVMAIVGALSAMVGPFAINTLEKAEAKTELLELENWLSKISTRAFYTGKEYKLSLSAHNAKLFTLKDGLLVKSVSFQSIAFPKQDITYNKSGFPSVSQIRGMYRGETLTLAINDNLTEVK